MPLKNACWHWKVLHTSSAVMFRMNGTPRAQGCAGAVPLSFARRIYTCMGAEVAQYLSSGLATSTPQRTPREGKAPNRYGKLI